MRQADTKRIDIRQTEQKQINGGLGGSTSLPTYEGMMDRRKVTDVFMQS